MPDWLIAKNAARYGDALRVSDRVRTDQHSMAEGAELAVGDSNVRAGTMLGIGS